MHTRRRIHAQRHIHAYVCISTHILICTCSGLRHRQGFRPGTSPETSPLPPALAFARHRQAHAHTYCKDVRRSARSHTPIQEQLELLLELLVLLLRVLHMRLAHAHTHTHTHTGFLFGRHPAWLPLPSPATASETHAPMPMSPIRLTTSQPPWASLCGLSGTRSAQGVPTATGPAQPNPCWQEPAPLPPSSRRPSGRSCREPIVLPNSKGSKLRPPVHSHLLKQFVITGATRASIRLDIGDDRGAAAS